MRYKTGVILGRFQPFHKGHLEYLLAAYDEVDDLIVGIVTPANEPTEYEPNDLSRLGEENNPFTYVERVQMIDKALEEIGMLPDHINFVHFQPKFVDEWYEEVPKDAVYFVTSGIDETSADVENKKADEMRARGLHVIELDIPEQGETYSATDIRNKMLNEEEWRHLVPAAVAEYLTEIGAEERVREFNKS